MIGTQYVAYKDGNQVHQYKFTAAEMQEIRTALWKFLKKIKLAEIRTLIEKIKKVELPIYELHHNASVKINPKFELQETVRQLSALLDAYDRSPFAWQPQDDQNMDEYLIDGPINQYFDIDKLFLYLKNISRLIDARIDALAPFVYPDAERELAVARNDFTNEGRMIQEFQTNAATFVFWGGFIIFVAFLIAIRETLKSGRQSLQDFFSAINYPIDDESTNAIMISPLIIMMAMTVRQLNKSGREIVRNDVAQIRENLIAVRGVINDEYRIAEVRRSYFELKFSWGGGFSDAFLQRQHEILTLFRSGEFARDAYEAQNRNSIFANQRGNENRNEPADEARWEIRPATPS